MVFILWIVFTVIVTFIGSDRKIGAGAAFLISLLLSPLIGIIVVAMSPTLESERHKNQMLKTQAELLEATKALANKPIHEGTDQQMNVDNMQQFQKMYELGLITEAEYNERRQKLLNSISGVD